MSEKASGVLLARASLQNSPPTSAATWWFSRCDHVGSLNVFVPGTQMIRPHEKLLIALTAFSILTLVGVAGADETTSPSSRGRIAASRPVDSRPADSWPGDAWLTGSCPGEESPNDAQQHGARPTHIAFRDIFASSLGISTGPLVVDMYEDQTLIRPHAVPEPYGYLLAAVGLLGLLGMGTAVRWRRKSPSPYAGGEHSSISGPRHRHNRSTQAKKRSLAHS